MKLDLLGHTRSLARRLLRAGKDFDRDDCGVQAAGIAFFSGVSILPMLLIMISAIGAFFEFSDMGRDAEAAVLEAAATHLSVTLQSHVREILEEVRVGSSLSGPLGALALLLSGLGGFVYLDRAFDRIGHRESDLRSDEGAEKGEGGLLLGAWRIVRRVLESRLTAFAILSALGLLIVLSASIDLLFDAVMSRLPEQSGLGAFMDRRSLSRAVGPLVPFSVNVMAVALLYRWVPRAKLRWRAAFQGAVLVGVLWEVGRKVLALWLASRGLESAYGVLGAFLLLQIWVYYTSMALLFGAEFAFGFRQET